MQHERASRELHPDASLDDGMERARRRTYYRPQHDSCSWLRYLAIIAACIAWTLVIGWLVIR